MEAKEILRRGLEAADLVVRRYLDDLPESFWEIRPHPACQTLNWQFGHLILSEATMICGSLHKPHALDENFVRTYEKKDRGASELLERLRSESPTIATSPEPEFCPAELWKLYRQQRECTIECLLDLSVSDLERPAAPSIQAYCPTVADAFVMTTTHWLMHSGQWVILRRLADLPITL